LELLGLELLGLHPIHELALVRESRMEQLDDD
jgi:hypothetical protein